jgi:choline kinase
MQTQTAIVLAAGRGTRLGPRAKAIPKPLIEVHGQSLILRMLHELSGVGVRRAVVVVGHLGEALESAVRGWDLPLGVEFVMAPDFATTNNSMSLLAAASYLREGAWIVEADVLVEPGVLAHVAGLHPQADAVWITAPFLPTYDGCCLRADDTGRIVDLSIRRRPFPGPPPGTHKSVGLVRISSGFAPRVIASLEAFRDRGETGVYYDLVLRTLLSSSQFRAGSIGSRFWIEIDDQDDLIRATNQFPVGGP